MKGIDNEDQVRLLMDPSSAYAEAAAMARGRAPGARRRFGFEHLTAFQPETFRSIQDEGKAKEKQADPRLFGSDTDPPGYTQASIATVRLWRAKPGR